MNIILAAVEPPLADAWEHYCGDPEGVTVHRGSILDPIFRSLFSRFWGFSLLGVY